VDYFLDFIVRKSDPIVRSANQFSFILYLVLFTSFLGSSPTHAVNQGMIANPSHAKEKSLDSQNFRPNQQISPTGTININLPIIEQNAQTTSEPKGDDTGSAAEVEFEPGTPTPTPIPVQTGTVNLPIVIGALAIIIVIILAWFFVGFLPSRNRE
jgi:hypothetical protein